MARTKKALSSVWAALLAAIIFAVSTFVLLQLISKGGKVATDAAEREQCLDSVRAQALISQVRPDSPVDLRCRTRYVTVTDTDLAKQKLTIAKEMRNCYGQLGEGKVKLFDLEQGAYCVVCAKLDFAKPGRLDHFTQFLLDTKLHEGQTYYQ
ncbi:MAG: hypothetical protein AABY13_04930, partial [Nanoarchaeota archaeon]